MYGLPKYVCGGACERPPYCIKEIYTDKSLQLLCILSFGILCLSAISMMFVKIMLVVCILVGMVI